ncbi:MAG: 4Fe-4S dicluster domain-containing protein [Syntrophales bacterium]|nr:4Fe-4S dicluster domain-containing protein [Syntrophales bacterium]
MDEGILKAKLGLNVFKLGGGPPHISIRKGMEKTRRLRHMVSLCPAGLYREQPSGEVTLQLEGCLECGTCRIVCGNSVLEWDYPEGGTGVQYRFG